MTTETALRQGFEPAGSPPVRVERGPAVAACYAPYGRGGLGQHFAQVVEELRDQGALVQYLSSGVRPGDEGVGVVLGNGVAEWLTRWSPARFRPGWRSFLVVEGWDRRVAAQLRVRAHSYVGFVGQSLHAFRRARALGYERLELVAANSHVRNVLRQHARATGRYGIEESWLNGAQARKTLREYAMADVIHVASEYSRASFLAEGIPAGKLVKTTLKVHPRFRPPERRPDDGVFRIVYSGSLTVNKGVPLLLEAFARLPVRRAELRLVGGWTTRAMRRHLGGWMARDPRIQVGPGDPLPHLQRADVCVHPTFEDGFAYAPMEALACGVPVIVSADTGMKEHVVEGVNGYVFPTGDVDALVDLLAEVRRRPLRGGWSL